MSQSKIIDNGDGTYTLESFTVRQPSMEAAEFALIIVDNGDGTFTRGGTTSNRNSFSGMAPDGWVEPIIITEK